MGGALAAGFKLTSRLLGTTPRESVDRQARAARSSSQPGTIDVEAKVQPPAQAPVDRPLLTDMG